MDALGEDRSLLAFDNPCCGQSCAPANADPDLGDLADMLDRGCDALGLEQVALYGTHTGAHIAVAWALAQPDRIKSLVIDGVALLDDDKSAEFLTNYAPPQTPDETGTQFHWAWNFIRDQMIFWPHYRKDAEHLRPGGSFDAKTLHRLTLDVLNSLETYHLPYEAVFRHDLVGDLRKLDLPVLVLGDEDTPLDPSFDAVVASIRGARSARTCATANAKAAAIVQFLGDQ